MFLAPARSQSPARDDVGRNSRRSRRYGFESLEDRQLLSGGVTVGTVARPTSTATGP